MLGYILKRYDYPVAPAVLGIILAELIETNYRRAIILEKTIPNLLLSFFKHPISIVLVLIIAFMFLSLSLQTVYGFDVRSFSIQGCLRFWCLLSSTSMLPVLWCLLSSTSRLPALWYLLSSRLFALRFFAVLLSSYILFLIA